MEITKALPSNLSELAEFARSTYSTAFGKEMGLAALNQHLTDKMTDEHFKEMHLADVFYLVRENGELVGFAQVGIVDKTYEKHVADFDPSGRELRRLYVKTEWQSQGIGSELIAKALGDLEMTGIKNAYVTTWETNFGAQRLYRKHGFDKIGEIPEYCGEGKLNGYEYIMVRRS